MIPICRPLLPDAKKLLPYLERIDSTRHYTNFAYLLREYESRLEEHFNSHVIVTSSGTAALIATLIAMELPKRTCVTVPSFTFVASAAAIVSAGYIPHFVDVNNDTWVATPPSKHKEAVMMVAPFGKSVACSDYGVPTLIDAAAGFSTIVASNIPAIVSTHATKEFCTGEGGFVVCHDKNLIEKIRVIINHGLSPDRSINTIGINGKMSEYHAAIGLAELDGWPEKCEKWQQVKEWYSGCHVKDIGRDAEPIATKLREKGIDTRLSWYGVAHQPAYRHYPRTDLGVTERLIKGTIALPYYVDMRKEDVEYILSTLGECLA